MKLLFQQGEEVIIQSKHYPEYNNREDVVRQVIDTGITDFPALWREPITGTLVRLNTRYAYLLQHNKERLSNNGDNLIVASWGERSLRKKHKPSDSSFQNMIESLKRPQKLS